MGTPNNEWKTTERIFDMMKYLCQVRYSPMPKLADKYGVSVRTIKRDIDVLGSLIPLRTKLGRYEGGVYVMEGYRWDRIYMSEEDTALLVKIRNAGQRQEKLILNQESVEHLTKIISNYSIPK